MTTGTSADHIIVTGGTGGIGQAIAKKLLKAGNYVTLTGRNPEKLKAALVWAEQIPTGKIQVVQSDLTIKEDREKLAAKAMTFAPITGLVNNAGVFHYAKLEQLTEEAFDKVWTMNTKAAIFLTQLVYEQLKKRGKGKIVNVSSLSGLRGGVGMTAYAASKFAMIGFTHSLAVEAIKFNINVNAVCPGFVSTSMADDVLKNQAEDRKMSEEEQRRRALSGIPSGRMSTPEEVAEAVFFLLSDGANNIVGESLKLSGGAVL